MKRLVGPLVVTTVLVIVLGGAWFWLKNSIQKEDLKFVGDNMEVSDDVKDRYETSELGISNNSEKINLSAQGNNSGSGMATRELAGEVFLHTILANLEEPALGTFYEGWLIRESDNDRVYTGRLLLNKGGWLLEYVSRKDLRDHKLVWVTIESRDDQKPEEKILEGRFK